MSRISKKVLAKSERINKKIRKIYLMFVITALMFIYNIMPASAATGSGGKFGDSVFAKGTKDLFTDVGIYLVVLAPIVGGAVGTYFFIRRGASDDMDQKKWNDRIKATIVSTIAATLVAAAITLISSYYK